MLQKLLQTKCQNLSGTSREFERLNEQGMEKIVESMVSGIVHFLAYFHC
jgi:hypothetical protein